MKKIKLLFALCLCYCLSFAQMNEMPWCIPLNTFNTNVDPPTNTSIGYGSASSTSSNGAYDVAGSLKFYVQGTNIVYSGGTIGLPILAQGPPYYQTWCSAGDEIEIVPVPGNCNQYYVIYELNTCSSGGSGAYTSYVMVDCSSSTPVMYTPSNYTLALSGYEGGLAVSKTIASDNSRYLFTLDSYGMERFTIGPWNSSTSVGIDSKVTLTALTSAIINSSNATQLELSPNQTLLAWTSGVYNNSVYEVKLTSTYGFSSYTTYSIPGLGSLPVIYGLEYSSSNKLYVSTNAGITYFTSGSSPTYNSLTTTAAYGTTQLKSMGTGNILGVNGGKLFEIDVSSNTLAFSSNTTSINSQFNSSTGGKYVYHLPDAIDNPNLAGPNKTALNPGNCCGETPAVIGTPAVTGWSYSWTPSTNLSSTTTAITSSSWSNTASCQIYALTVSYTGCASATYTVQVCATNLRGSCCERSTNQNAALSFTEVPSNISVYPNPSNGNVSISLGADAEYVHITDMQGRLVYEIKETQTSDFKVDISKYNKGIYFISAKIGDTIEKQKLIVE